MQPKKKTSPIFWVAILGLGAVAYVFTTPEEPTKKVTTTRNNSRKTTTVSLITEEDLKAKFDRVNIAAKNAFKPVIKKISAEAGSVSPSALPLSFTGGESGWIYTGTASVDGRIQAVVENHGTGQGDFLSVGQKWKQSRVVAVTESSLILESADGQQATIKMQEKLSGTSMTAGGFAPVDVNPGLRGPIGPLAVRPESAGQETVASEGDGNAN